MIYPDKDKQFLKDMAYTLSEDISQTISALDESVRRHSESVIPSNTRSDEEDRALAKAQILSKLCVHYRKLTPPEQETFAFDSKIFRRKRSEGGFGLRGWEQEFIDKQLENLRLSGIIVRNGNVFSLTEAGKRLCSTLS